MVMVTLMMVVMVMVMMVDVEVVMAATTTTTIAFCASPPLLVLLISEAGVPAGWIRVHWKVHTVWPGTKSGTRLFFFTGVANQPFVQLCKTWSWVQVLPTCFTPLAANLCDSVSDLDANLFQTWLQVCGRPFKTLANIQRPVWLFLILTTLAMPRNLTIWRSVPASYWRQLLNEATV